MDVSVCAVLRVVGAAPGDGDVAQQQLGPGVDVEHAEGGAASAGSPPCRRCCGPRMSTCRGAPPGPGRGGRWPKMASFTAADTASPSGQVDDVAVLGQRDGLAQRAIARRAEAAVRVRGLAHAAAFRGSAPPTVIVKQTWTTPSRRRSCTRAAGTRGWARADGRVADRVHRPPTSRRTGSGSRPRRSCRSAAGRRHTPGSSRSGTGCCSCAGAGIDVGLRMAERGRRQSNSSMRTGTKPPRFTRDDLPRECPAGRRREAVRSRASSACATRRRRSRCARRSRAAATRRRRPTS